MFQVIVAFIIFIVIPVGCGGLFCDLYTNKNKVYNILLCELFGFTWMLALYLPLAIIATLIYGALSVLTITWEIVVGISACLGYYLLYKNSMQKKYSGEEKGDLFKIDKKIIHSYKFKLFFILLCLVSIQVFAVCYFQHVDEDDYTYISIATTSWYTNIVGGYNELGESVDWRTMLPYSMSPFSIWCASISLMLRVHPTIFMHTILPGILIVIAYISYSYIGYTFLKDDFQLILKFCIIYAVLNIFGGFSVRAPGMFLLLRLWQGKAVATTIFMPLQFACIYHLVDEKQRKGDFLLLFCINAAIVLCSGMGIFQSGMICGCFLIIDFYKYKSLKRLLLDCVVLVPNIVVFVLNYM